MTTDESPQDVEQARRLLEVLHGDLLRTAYLEDSDGEHIAQAAGLADALDVVEQLEDGEFDAELAREALDGLAPEDPEVDAGALRDLSQQTRAYGLPSDHPVIDRAAIDRETRSRSRWAMLKQLVGWSR